MPYMNEQSITISDSETVIDKEELAELRSNAAFLEALIGAGVDNWSGYDDAQEMMSE